MADLHHEDHDNHRLHHVLVSIPLQNNQLPQNSNNPNCNDDANSVDDLNRHDSDDSSQCSDGSDDVGFGPRFFPQSFNNPNCDDDADSVYHLNRFDVLLFESDNSSQCSDDSDVTQETHIVSVEDGDCDQEESLHLWDAFNLEDENPNPNPNANSNSNANANANANEDFEWEEVDDQTDERDMFFGVEPDDDASVSPVLLTAFEDPSDEQQYGHDVLHWQVLSNVQNFEPNPYSEDQYDDYNYTEYEMFFGQFGDSDVPPSGRPPASKTAVVNLTTVVMSQEDVVNNNALCAVCKDEVAVGEMATQLPCSHRYHGECILPWLAVRNTCPVCRHELPTDDVEYERRKAERAGQA